MAYAPASKLFGPDALLASALEASPDCVKVIGLDGRIQYLNRGGCRLMAFASPEAVLGKPWTALWPAEAHQRMRRALRRARAGRHARFSGKCPTATGIEKDWDVMVSPLRSPGGEVIAVLAYSRDVTELCDARREAEGRERAHLRQTATLRSAGEIAKVGAWEMDFRTGEVSWSDETWRLMRGEPRPLTVPDVLSRFGEADAWELAS